jgi:hypothetical protein
MSLNQRGPGPPLWRREHREGLALGHSKEQGFTTFRGLLLGTGQLWTGEEKLLRVGMCLLKVSQEGKSLQAWVLSLCASVPLISHATEGQTLSLSKTQSLCL